MRNAEGLPLHSRRLLAVHDFVGFLDGRQFGEVRIANDVARLVGRAPREQRNRQSLLHERQRAAQIRSGCLIVDFELAALEPEPAFAAAREARDVLDVQPEQAEPEQGHEIKRGDALARVMDRAALQLAQRLQVDAELARDIGHAAGGAGQNEPELGVIVTDVLLLEEERELGRAGADEQREPVRLGSAANRLAPVTDPAPGTFRTIIVGLPGRYLPMTPARNRPHRSLPPPTPNGTMIVMV